MFIFFVGHEFRRCLVSGFDSQSCIMLMLLVTGAHSLVAGGKLFILIVSEPLLYVLQWPWAI